MNEMPTHPEVDEALSRVGAAPTSIGGAILHAYRAKEMGFEEYLNANAVIGAEMCHRARPKPYPVLAQSAMQYVTHRLDGGIDRDPAFHAKIGAWIAATVRAAKENEHELDHLIWLLARIRAVGMGELVKKVQRAADDFVANGEPDAKLLESALKVQWMDAKAKAYGEAKR
jgi:hypothetical protein